MAKKKSKGKSMPMGGGGMGMMDETMSDKHAGMVKHDGKWVKAGKKKRKASHGY